MGVYTGIAQDNVRINSGNANFDSLTVGGIAVQAGAPVVASAATLTVTAAAHAGRLVVLSRAAGIAVTLPAATGTGNTYRFSFGADVTSNTTTIKVANASDVMAGALVVTNEADATTTTFGTQATDDTITCNGGTTGGLAGGIIRIMDVATNVWAVDGVLVGNGSEADPLSATVS